MSESDINSGFDQDVIDAARAGDGAAFSQLYEEAFPMVYDFLGHMVRDRDEAADLTQDTFLKAYRGLPNLTDTSRFRPWLFTIARNAALNRIERRKRSTPVADDQMPEAPDAYDQSPLQDPEREVEMAEASALVWEAAEGLGERDASVLDLSVRQGLSNVEMAEVLGITANNANVTLSRVRDRFSVSLRARSLWHRGSPRCSDLASVLSELGNPTEFSPDLAKAITTHADGCDLCDDARKKVAPLAAFGALPPLIAPKEAKAATDGSLASQGVPVGEGLKDSDRQFGRSTRGRVARWLAVAAAVIVAGISVGALLALNSSEESSDTTAAVQPTIAGTGPLTLDVEPGTQIGRTPTSTGGSPAAVGVTPTASPTTKPTIESFSSSPTRVSSGEKFVVSWRVANASTVTISRIGSVAATGNSPQSVENTGCKATTVSYTLTAKSAAGTSSKSISVTVAGSCSSPPVG